MNAQSSALARTDPGVVADLVESALIGGDLAKLAPTARAAYYLKVCESIGLNPFTRPFEYIVLNGKLTLYARRDAAEQLRKLNNVSVRIIGRETTDEGIYIVTAQARLPSGREDESTGAVPLFGLKGEALANAYMKAETKAKRRVTLSICGLGWLDETEAESIPDAHAPRPEVSIAAPPYDHAAELRRLVAAGIAAAGAGDEPGYKATRAAVKRWCDEQGIEPTKPLAEIKAAWRAPVAPIAESPPTPRETTLPRAPVDADALLAAIREAESLDVAIAATRHAWAVGVHLPASMFTSALGDRFAEELRTCDATAIEAIRALAEAQAFTGADASGIAGAIEARRRGAKGAA